ncbi:MAG: hypothetical protein IK038_02830 [Bacteroidaceae bacterium]|nr:hypothetical protein [Bacteroidaceae bacterium]
MTFYEFTVNTIVEHPIVFGFCVLCLLAVLDKVKEVIVCIFTKGGSETNKKPKKTDDVVEPDYIIINKKDD